MEKLDLTEIVSSVESSASDVTGNIEDFVSQTEALMSNWHHCSPE